MTIKELKDMISLMHENGLTELEVEKDGFKIRLKKGPSGNIVQDPGPMLTQPARIQLDTEADEAKRSEEAGVILIRSPMVGTYYTAPAPDAVPYVSKGSEVSEGDVLCIIEAMKLMNEIKSEVRGRVIDLMVQNGQPVEFDQPLFKLQKA